MKLYFVLTLMASCLFIYPTCAYRITNSEIHEERRAESTQWIKVRRLEAGHVLQMRFALKEQNFHKAEELIDQVSHPSSLDYGRHFSKQDVIEIFAPSLDTRNTVKAWISRNGGSPVLSPDKGWFYANMTVKNVERMLQAEYFEYRHQTYGHRTVSCDRYSLPSSMKAHIDFIAPGVMLSTLSNSPLHTRSSRQDDFIKTSGLSNLAWNDTSNCGKGLTPACIRKLYSIPHNTLHHPNNSLGIYESGDFYAQEDLDLFFRRFAPKIPNGTHPRLVSIDGGSAPVKPKYADGESDLDLQVAYPLVYPQSITLYQTDDNDYTISGAGGLFNNFLDALDGSYCTYRAYGETGNDPAFDDSYPDTQNPDGYKGKLQCGTSKPANVISISYSKSELDLPFYYQQRQCNEFMKLALQGHTILVASGDAGVASRSFDPDPNGCVGPQHKVFNPNFPGNCPYVTVVGGTMIAPGKTINDPEVAAYLAHQDGSDETYTSGGGFSTIYATPNYQRSELQKYFSGHDPGYRSFSSLHNATKNDTAPIGSNGGIYNRIGRGIPDVSAISQNIATYVDVDYGLISGTSAATPLFASIITLINEHRLAIGKSPVGFLNPVLYANAGVFNDITQGHNVGCGTKGFSAVPGWDPVTGLGTPRFSKMLDLFMSLP